METDIILEADVMPAQVAELAQLAEGYGIRGLWTQNYANGRDAFMCLMPAAAATKKILLGAVVISPYEMHPLKIANAVSTLNEYSGGRGMVVIGGGGQWPGVIGVNYGKRVTGCGEAIAMVRRAVAGQVVKWDGEVYKARYFRSTWVKGKPPIIYAGATGPKMLDMATRFADGTMFSDMILPMLPRPWATCARARASTAASRRIPRQQFLRLPRQGGPGGVFRRGPPRTDAAGLARGAVVRALPHAGGSRASWREQERLPHRVPHPQRRHRASRRKSAPSWWRASASPAISSDLDRHAERLRTFAAAGMTENALRLHDDPARAMHIIGKELLPRLR